MKKLKKAVMVLLSVAVGGCAGAFAVACAHGEQPQEPPVDSDVEYFTVTAAQCANGSISVSASQSTSGYVKDEQVTVTVTPDAGYEVISFTVNGTAVTLTGGQYTFAVQGNTTLAATFDIQLAFTVNEKFVGTFVSLDSSVTLDIASNYIMYNDTRVAATAGTADNSSIKYTFTAGSGSSASEYSIYWVENTYDVGYILALYNASTESTTYCVNSAVTNATISDKYVGELLNYADGTTLTVAADKITVGDLQSQYIIDYGAYDTALDGTTAVGANIYGIVIGNEYKTLVYNASDGTGEGVDKFDKIVFGSAAYIKTGETALDQSFTAPWSLKSSALTSEQSFSFDNIEIDSNGSFIMYKEEADKDDSSNVADIKAVAGTGENAVYAIMLRGKFFTVSVSGGVLKISGEAGEAEYAAKAALPQTNLGTYRAKDGKYYNVSANGESTDFTISDRATDLFAVDGKTVFVDNGGATPSDVAVSFAAGGNIMVLENLASGAKTAAFKLVNDASNETTAYYANSYNAGVDASAIAGKYVATDASLVVSANGSTDKGLDLVFLSATAGADGAITADVCYTDATAYKYEQVTIKDGKFTLNGVEYTRSADIFTSAQQGVYNVKLGGSGSNITVSANSVSVEGVSYMLDLKEAENAFTFTTSARQTYTLTFAEQKNNEYQEIRVVVKNAGGVEIDGAGFTVAREGYVYSYTVEAVAAAGFGTVTFDGTAPYESGSTVTFTVTPDAGYSIFSVKVNGNDVTASEGKYSFNITQTSTVSVEYCADVANTSITGEYVNGETTLKFDSNKVFKGTDQLLVKNVNSGQSVVIDGEDYVFNTVANTNNLILNLSKDGKSDFYVKEGEPGSVTIEGFASETVFAGFTGNVTVTSNAVTFGSASAKLYGYDADSSIATVLFNGVVYQLTFGTDAFDLKVYGEAGTLAFTKTESTAAIFNSEQIGIYGTPESGKQLVVLDNALYLISTSATIKSDNADESGITANGSVYSFKVGTNTYSVTFNMDKTVTVSSDNPTQNGFIGFTSAAGESKFAGIEGVYYSETSAGKVVVSTDYMAIIDNNNDVVTSAISGSDTSYSFTYSPSSLQQQQTYTVKINFNTSDKTVTLDVDGASDSKYEYTATQTPNFQVNVTNDTDKGTITFDGDTDSDKKFAKGSKVSFSVAPENDYAVYEVTVNGKKVDEEGGKYSFNIFGVTNISVAYNVALTGFSGKYNKIGGDDESITLSEQGEFPEGQLTKVSEGVYTYKHIYTKDNGGNTETVTDIYTVNAYSSTIFSLTGEDGKTFFYLKDGASAVSTINAKYNDNYVDGETTIAIADNKITLNSAETTTYVAEENLFVFTTADSVYVFNYASPYSRIQVYTIADGTQVNPDIFALADTSKEKLAKFNSDLIGTYKCESGNRTGKIVVDETSVEITSNSSSGTPVTVKGAITKSTDGKVYTFLVYYSRTDAFAYYNCKLTFNYNDETGALESVTLDTPSEGDTANFASNLNFTAAKQAESAKFTEDEIGTYISSGNNPITVKVTEDEVTVSRKGTSFDTKYSFKSSTMQSSGVYTVNLLQDVTEVVVTITFTEDSLTIKSTSGDTYGYFTKGVECTKQIDLGPGESITSFDADLIGHYESDSGSGSLVVESNKLTYCRTNGKSYDIDISKVTKYNGGVYKFTYAPVWGDIVVTLAFSTVDGVKQVAVSADPDSANDKFVAKFVEYVEITFVESGATGGTIDVTGYNPDEDETLKYTVEKDTTIEFTVEAPEGYTIASVKAGETDITNDGGTYSYEVTGAATITITYAEKVKFTEAQQGTYTCAEDDKAKIIVGVDDLTITGKNDLTTWMDSDILQGGDANTFTFKIIIFKLSEGYTAYYDCTLKFEGNNVTLTSVYTSGYNNSAYTDRINFTASKPAEKASFSESIQGTYNSTTNSPSVPSTPSGNIVITADSITIKLNKSDSSPTTTIIGDIQMIQKDKKYKFTLQVLNESYQYDCTLTFNGDGTVKLTATVASGKTSYYETYLAFDAKKADE